MPRGKLTIAAVGAVIDRMVIKAMIQQFYKLTSAMAMELRTRKRNAGYCGGSPSCMEHTGIHTLCAGCKKNRENPRYKKPVYEYGKIRAREKKQERQSQVLPPAKRKKAA